MEEQFRQLGSVAIAAGLGAMVGIEREFADKPAGLRTHMLVCAASAALMLIGDAVLHRFQENTATSISADPLRIIQAIIVGISFLGAGTIIHHGDHRVEGLTTASSILLTSAIGIAVAVHQNAFACGVACLTVLVLLVVRQAEKRIANRLSKKS
ncbi:MAG: MgtC/SapB family protein [Planctomycetaceae bacterium]|nr:MgtC/SapB family protein [Planctomycetaceae bacterium]